MGLFFFIKFNENSPSEENTYVYARLGFRFSWVLARFRYPVGLFFFIMFMYFPPVCSGTILWYAAIRCGTKGGKDSIDAWTFLAHGQLIPR